MTNSNNTISRRVPVVAEIVNLKFDKINKVKTPKISSIAENGLSVKKLREIGHKISVHHYRTYWSDDVNNFIYLPSSTRFLHDPCITLLPEGGYTRIAISPLLKEEYQDFAEFKEVYNTRINDDEVEQRTDYFGPTYYYTSYCLPPDLFCYKLGVTNALNKVSDSYAQALLNGAFDGSMYKS